MDEWIRSAILDKDASDAEKQASSTWQLPIVRSWYAFAIAHAYKTILDGRSIKASDRGDWDHYAYAAVGGTLVTDDKMLREIAARIELGHVRVLHMNEFLAEID